MDHLSYFLVPGESVVPEQTDEVEENQRCKSEEVKTTGAPGESRGQLLIQKK